MADSTARDGRGSRRWFRGSSVEEPQAVPAVAGPSTELRHRSTDDLLADWAPLHAELARRFGNSNIVGCYGEALVAAAVGGRVRSNSAAGGDIELADGRLVEVKCRRAGDSAGRHASGVYEWDRAINDWPFDFAAFVQLDEETLAPVRAFILDVHHLDAPKLFGTKSPVLGQQIYGNRRYVGEIDLLDAMRAGASVALPPERSARLTATAAGLERLAPPPGADELRPDHIRLADSAPPAGNADGQSDWIWLSGEAMEEFKRWRVRGGATPASASSYASGARAFVRYCRSIDRHPKSGDEGFLAYLERRTEVSPRARSDYRSHARAFVRFLNEHPQR